MSSITPEFLKQKAREISYALNKVSFYIKRNELKQRLERLSFEFLENVAVGCEDISDRQELIKIFKNIAALDVLVRIGYSLYEIEPINANLLIGEIDSFNSAIRQLVEAKFGNNSANPFGEVLPNLESVFSTPPVVIDNSAISQPANSAIEQTNNSVPPRNARRESPMQQDRIGTIQQSIKNADLATIDKEKEIVEKAYLSVKDLSVDNSVVGKEFLSKEEVTNKTVGNNGNLAPTKGRESPMQQNPIGTIRQNLISEKIRQSGKTNLKDLINQFPGVSERTLRYDLQRLCDQGIIEKIGSSGPGTNYIPKNIENSKI